MTCPLVTRPCHAEVAATDRPIEVYGEAVQHEQSHLRRFVVGPRRRVLSKGRVDKDELAADEQKVSALAFSHVPHAQLDHDESEVGVLHLAGCDVMGTRPIAVDEGLPSIGRQAAIAFRKRGNPVLSSRKTVPSTMARDGSLTR